ncbi:hypothetical protein [Ralstonia pseudosolanacearum]|uniref:hypothetical protein n=1 Tax=Ralstonia pseudosolanacearum TaxID=1310165 RepID=UPI001FF94162|nr:hypothetical protein [Ralstonia pseudosolanacearum]
MAYGFRDDHYFFLKICAALLEIGDESKKKKSAEALSLFPWEHASIMVRVDGDADRGFFVRQALIQVAQLLASLRFTRLAEVID